MKEPLLQGNLFLSLLWKHWSSSHCYFEPSRSHYWIVGIVVFHSCNPMNAVSASVISTSPQENQPHVDPSASSTVRSSSPSSLARSSSISSSSSSESFESSNLVNRKKKKRKNKMKKSKKGSKLPTTVRHVGKNQLLLIVLGVLMMSRSPKQLVSPSTLVGFVRVSIFLRISLVYPRL
jgi:hypothetical protein